MKVTARALADTRVAGFSLTVSFGVEGSMCHLRKPTRSATQSLSLSNANAGSNRIPAFLWSPAAAQGFEGYLNEVVIGLPDTFEYPAIAFGRFDIGDEDVFDRILEQCDLGVAELPVQPVTNFI